MSGQNRQDAKREDQRVPDEQLVANGAVKERFITCKGKAYCRKADAFDQMTVQGLSRKFSPVGTLTTLFGKTAIFLMPEPRILFNLSISLQVFVVEPMKSGDDRFDKTNGYWLICSIKLWPSTPSGIWIFNRLASVGAISTVQACAAWCPAFTPDPEKTIGTWLS